MKRSPRTSNRKNQIRDHKGNPAQAGNTHNRPALRSNQCAQNMKKGITTFAILAILAHAIIALNYACHGDLIAFLTSAAGFPFTVWTALEAINPSVPG
jgi:hypothetical protein